MSYFDRLAKSDIHVSLDHVAVSKGDFVNRTRIQQRDGRVMWLTIPTKAGVPINELGTHYAPDHGNWRHKHARSLYQCYPDIPHLATKWFHRHYLVGVLKQTTDFLADQLGVTTERVSSAGLGGSKLGTKSELVLNLCKEVGATTYLSGPHGRDYLDLPAFERAGIEVEWHDYPVVQPVLSAVHDLFSQKVAA